MFIRKCSIKRLNLYVLTLEAALNDVISMMFLLFGQQELVKCLFVLAPLIVIVSIQSRFSNADFA